MRIPRKARRILPLVMGLLLLGALAWGGASGAVVAWGSLDYGSPQSDWLWTGGQPILDVSVDGSGPTTWVHNFYSSDTDDAEANWPAYDCKAHTGQIHAGGYYTRSSDWGANWQARFRLTDANMHAERTTGAADGQYVHAVYVSQQCYVYDNNGGWKFGNKPRVMYYRVNDNYGDSANWGPETSMTPTKNRIDYPVLDAANGTVLIAYTLGNKGQVVVKRSTDNGASWTTTKVGKTTATYNYYGPEGYRSYPTVAITPEGDALVTYSKSQTKRNKGDLWYRTSTDGGATWAPEAKMEGKKVLMNGSFPNSDAVSNRIGLAWAKAGKVMYREYDGATDTWGAKTLVWTPADPWAAAEVPMPTLNGANQVGIAFGGCKLSGCPQNGKNQIDMLYAESTDNGATWTPETVVQLGNVGGNSAYNLQTWGDVVFENDTTRHIVWNNWKSNYGHYMLYERTGTGTA